MYDMINQGRSKGVFLLQSPAQLKMGQRLKSRSLLDLAYQVALIRPGVGVQGSSVSQFVERYRHGASWEYDHPLEQRALERGYGIIVWPEQVVQLIMDVAGFTAAQADEVRRAFARPHSDHLVAVHRGRFLEGARSRGVSKEIAKKIFAKINGHYMFPESHSHAFAVTAYQAAWLKRYHPLEFFVTLMNNQPIGHLEPGEMVAVVEVHDGRWGLSDFALEGNRYLITIEAPGLRVKPAGYVAVLFGGRAEHLLRGVDFYVGDSGEPYCDSDSGIVEPTAREALRNILKDPMARIAERVPGFGGAFRDSDQNIVYIYLQDASMQEEAERALTEEFGPDFLAGREVQVLKGEYSMDHLDAWYRTLSGAISQVPGILYTDLDEGKNRIEIVMYPRRGGREEMEAAIATMDVPRGAIVIDVGCEGKWPRDFGEPPEDAFLRAVDYSLELVSQAP